MRALRQDPENKCFVMDATKDALDQASGFDKDHWPDFADRTWQDSVHRHYNAPPYWI